MEIRIFCKFTKANLESTPDIACDGGIGGTCKTAKIQYVGKI